MIVYDLDCAAGHRFEGWFRSSDDYSEQRDKGAIACPHCDSRKVQKAVSLPHLAKHAGKPRAAAPQMAPAGDRFAGAHHAPPLPAALEEEMQTVFRKLRRHVEQTCEDVGLRFAEEARRIHYGESEARGIYGEATAPETAELIEEGIEIMPLPGPARREDA